MQSKVNANQYLCQNCATEFHPPEYRDQPMVLLQDGNNYSWVSRVSRNIEIPLETCCELPYIQEMAN